MKRKHLLNHYIRTTLSLILLGIVTLNSVYASAANRRSEKVLPFAAKPVAAITVTGKITDVRMLLEDQFQS